MVTDEFKEELKTSYDGTNAQYFATKYNVTKNVVFNWASKLKVSSTPKRNDHLEEEIFRLYFEEKKTIKQIHKILNVGKSSIDKMLKKRGGGRAKTEMYLNKLNLDVDFFEKLDTAEKAYWFGFIAADGNIYINRLQIGLAKKDLGHLEKFVQRINYKGKIHKDGRHYKLIITRKKMVDDLKKLGLTYNKTLILNERIFDCVPDEFIPAFMHGYFDGDGCFTKLKSGYKQFSLLGNKEFLSKFKRLLKEFDIECSDIKHDKRTKQTYFFYGSMSRTVDKWIDLFYSGDNKSSDFLERKYQKLIS